MSDYTMVTARKSKKVRNAKKLNILQEKYKCIISDKMGRFLYKNQHILTQLMNNYDGYLEDVLLNDKTYELEHTYNTKLDMKTIKEIILEEFEVYIELGMLYTIFTPGSCGTVKQTETSDIDILVIFNTRNVLLKEEYEAGITFKDIYNTIYDYLVSRLGSIDMVWYCVNERVTTPYSEHIYKEEFINNNIGDLIQGTAQIVYPIELEKKEKDKFIDIFADMYVNNRYKLAGPRKFNI